MNESFYSEAEPSSAFNSVYRLWVHVCDPTQYACIASIDKLLASTLTVYAALTGQRAVRTKNKSRAGWSGAGKDDHW